MSDERKIGLMLIICAVSFLLVVAHLVVSYISCDNSGGVLVRGAFSPVCIHGVK